ncbi:MAG: hypothetical protein MRT15_12105 [archaeon YNP-LCB-003-016]|uniref:hypothetical protein n=1 Tax=Candidatus Culexarchaeum yellowstonense TaxID=2928963 RepID=UPI0026F2C022|nr:hypothetical protein [Candidatus Culexarchaeum yellowstonense]MCR6693129.1 hypothetical protein [Candidatus Culexarchaeum yellowstonense]
MVESLNKNEEVQCGICYTCQTCVTCEKYGEIRGQATTQQPPQEQRMPVIRPQPPQMPMQMPQPIPPSTQLLTVEDIRRIVKEAMLEVLLQLDLVKPHERKRELK